MNAHPKQAPSDGFTIVNRHLQFPKVTLQPPTSSGYIHIAAEIDPIRPFGFGPTGAAKREAVARSLAFCRELERNAAVRSAKALVGAFLPPGHGALQLKRPDIHVAKFDLVVLIETETPPAAIELQGSPAFTAFIAFLHATAKFLHVVRARNGRKIGEVDKARDGVFLFNYFHGDDPAKLVPVWEYTAGWFQDRTGLDNSILLTPEVGQRSEYGIINHCRWDHWLDILPSLRFRPTFRSYVLANFEANGIVPMPVLYTLAR